MSMLVMRVESFEEFSDDAPNYAAVELLADLVKNISALSDEVRYLGDRVQNLVSIQVYNSSPYFMDVEYEDREEVDKLVGEEGWAIVDSLPGCLDYSDLHIPRP